ncbi:MAG: DUF2934 domain-containing protein [Xanthobacteraceae bacterium]|nr:DUF2934 domain-containing protein [Xanthobacteraceae bacterium]
MDHTMPYDANLERRIRERAFRIWIEEGQPRGRDQAHWLIAEAELTSGSSPPLQPDQPIGQVSQAQQQTGEQARRRTDAEAFSIVGGTNPDDVTR